jgi:hypothetical protein
MKKLKLLAFAGILATTALSAQKNVGTTGSSSQYPLTLSVTRAMRYNASGMTMTNAEGYLSDAPDQMLRTVCDVGIFSLDANNQPGNTYPARYNGHAHQVKLAVRLMGGDKTHEYTCKY